MLTKISTFSYVFQSVMAAKFGYHQVAGEKLINDQVFKLFVSDQLKVTFSDVGDKYV